MNKSRVLAKELGVGRPARGSFDRMGGGLRLRFSYARKPLTSDESEYHKVLRIPLRTRPLSVVFGRAVLPQGEGPKFHVDSPILTIHGQERIQRGLKISVSAYNVEGRQETADLVRAFCLNDTLGVDGLPIPSIAISFNDAPRTVSRVHGLIVVGSNGGLLSYEIVRFGHIGRVRLSEEEEETLMEIGHTRRSLDPPITIAFTPY